jgi:hypothetical protein
VVVCDLAKLDSLESTVKEAMKAFGYIDILMVNERNILECFILLLKGDNYFLLLFDSFLECVCVFLSHICSSLSHSLSLCVCLSLLYIRLYRIMQDLLNVVLVMKLCSKSIVK